NVLYILPVNRPRRIGAFCNLVDVPAHRLQFPDICFCVASVNDKDIPVNRHFAQIRPVLLYGKLLHLLVDQPLFFFRNVKLHLYISLSVFHFCTAFSSSQAAYRSFPLCSEKSLIPLLVLSPQSLAALRGTPRK